MVARGIAVALAAVAVTACGGVRTPSPPAIAIDDSHRLPATSPSVAAGAPVAGLACGTGAATRYGVHVELFVNGRVVLLPAGIGMAPPWQVDPPYVTAGRCSYPLRTVEPTGVVEVAPEGRMATLGDLFAVWGQPLGAEGFGRWSAAPGEHLGVFVDGSPFAGDPRSVPLRPHAQIVLEVGTPRVPPHARYRFAPGL
jgi:hypothetical protein